MSTNNEPSHDDLYTMWLMRKVNPATGADGNLEAQVVGFAREVLERYRESRPAVLVLPDLIDRPDGAHKGGSLFRSGWQCAVAAVRDLNPFAAPISIKHLARLERDAVRWGVARQFLSTEDIERWEEFPVLHAPEESESVKTDLAIDALLALNIHGGDFL